MAKTSRPHKAITVTIALFTFGIISLAQSQTALAYIDVDTCLNSARNAFPPGYVDTFISSFQTRCDTSLGGGVNTSNQAFGMEAPVSTDFPESTGQSAFTFDAQRIVYVANPSYSEGSKGDIYARVTSRSDHARFNGGTTVDHLSCEVTTGGWIKGSTMSVSVDASFFGANSGGTEDGIIDGAIPYTTCFKGKDDKCRDNNLYFKVYEITYITHGTASATYNGNSVSLSDSNPTTVDAGTIYFNHQLRRNDSWSKPANPYLSNTYKRSISKNSATLSEERSYQGISLSANGFFSTITDSVNVADLNLQAGIPTQICSTVTYKKYKSLSSPNVHTAYQDNENQGNLGTSTICVWVKNDTMTAKSYSAVSTGISTAKVYSTNTPNIASVSNTGGSQQSSYTFNF